MVFFDARKMVKMNDDPKDVKETLYHRYIFIFPLKISKINIGFEMYCI